MGINRTCGSCQWVLQTHTRMEGEILPLPAHPTQTAGVITWAFIYWRPPLHALYHTSSNPLPDLMKQVLTPILQMGKVVTQNPRADPVIWSSNITHFGDHLISKRRQNYESKTNTGLWEGYLEVEVALKYKFHRKSVSGKSHRQWQSWWCGQATKPVLSASRRLRPILALNLALSHTHSPATHQLPNEPIAQRGKLRQDFYSRCSKRIRNREVVARLLVSDKAPLTFEMTLISGQSQWHLYAKDPLDWLPNRLS